MEGGLPLPMGVLGTGQHQTVNLGPGRGIGRRSKLPVSFTNAPFSLLSSPILSCHADLAVP